MKAIVVLLLILLTSGEASAETWTATGYDNCISCCGKTDGITASGKHARAGHTVAINWLKFGTHVLINGREYVVEDRGAKSIFGDKQHHKKAVDIFFNTHKEALKYGKRKVELTVKGN